MAGLQPFVMAVLLNTNGEEAAEKLWKTLHLLRHQCQYQKFMQSHIYDHKLLSQQQFSKHGVRSWLHATSVLRVQAHIRLQKQ